MNTAITLLVALVALEHIYFLILEMFLWTKPKGRHIFGLTEQFAKDTQSLAANQGLYNGFLAAGLVWSLVQTNVYFAYQLQLFFLSCVIVAAIFGAATVKRTILLIQGVPAITALICVLFAHYSISN
jgi:putative membrane protein